MTNFATIRKSIKKMQSIDKMLTDGTFENITKKERLMLTRQKEKMERVLGGIANLNRVPAALFIVDISHEHIAVAEGRVHGQDVRFGLISLAETADRALSPGINDPGTAIVIMGRQLAVLTRWAEVSRKDRATKVRFDRVYVPPLTAQQLVRDCFIPIARDGAGAVEVGIRLQRTLAALVRLDRPDLTSAAVAMSDEALVLAEHALVAEAHKARVRAAAKEVQRLAMADSEAERNHAADEDVSF